ncbi:MAG: type II secretion system protein [Victivallaceae bacterium]|nr:type II secretion system protein [Victivallaceae bacterium]
MRKKFHPGGVIEFHPYSLVEMLVVLAIIAILAGLGAGGYQAGRRWLATIRTEALLAKLRLAIQAYKTDKGYYPLPHNNEVNFKLDTNARDFDSGYSSDVRHQPRNNLNYFLDYGKIQADQSQKIHSGDCNYYYVKDGWHAPSATMTVSGHGYSWGAIKYRCPGQTNTNSFDLYSAGPDRQFGTSDDIYAK